MHKIEIATDPLMMGWVLETYLQKYIADFQRLDGLALDSKNVNPALWTPINCHLGTPLRDASEMNLGFLFKSNAKIVTDLIEHTRKEDMAMHFCIRHRSRRGINCQLSVCLVVSSAKVRKYYAAHSS